MEDGRSATSTLTTGIPVTGGDYFALAIDRMMRRRGLPGNLCRLQLDLDGRLDGQRLGRALEALPAARQLAQLRMKRPLIGYSPRWCVDPRSSGVPKFAMNASDAAIRLDRAPVYRVQLERLEHHDRLSLHWHHCLMDVDGALTLIRALRDGYNRRPNGNGPRLAQPDQRIEPLGVRLRAFAGRIRHCRPSISFVNTTSRPPFATLAPGGNGTELKLNFRVVRLDEDETARVERRLEAMNAGLFASLFMLACSVRALAPILRRRRGRDEAIVVPMPHATRGRAGQPTLLSNHLSFLFFRVEPECTGRLDLVYADLLRQFRAQIVGRTHEAFGVAMDLFRPVPLLIYNRNLKRPTRGRMATFYYSYVNPTQDDDVAWDDCRVRDVTHMPMIGYPPGLAFIHYRHRGLPRVVISSVDAALKADEVEELAERMKRILTGRES